MDELQIYDVTSAENALAGAILTAPEEAVPKIREVASVEDFNDEVCRNIYAAAVGLLDFNKPADVSLISVKLAENGHPVSDEIIYNLLRLGTRLDNLKPNAEKVHEAAVKRRERSICYAGAIGEKTASEVIADLQKEEKDQRSGIMTPGEASNHFYDFLLDRDAKPFVKTGFNALDSILGGGLVHSGLITLAARPRIGKTVVGLNIADAVAEQGIPVLYEALEMDNEQLWARRISVITGIPYSKIYNKELSTEELEGPIFEANRMLSHRPLEIAARPVTIDGIERDVRTAKKDYGLIVIDHIGLIDSGSKRLSLYEQMTYKSHRLKQLAISTGIPVLALCQLNRASEMRDDHRPTMADLRDSGAIEEDSDAVILLHRPAEYLPQNQRPRPWEFQDIDLILEKNRHGLTGTLTMDFSGMCAMIQERWQSA